MTLSTGALNPAAVQQIAQTAELALTFRAGWGYACPRCSPAPGARRQDAAMKLFQAFRRRPAFHFTTSDYGVLSFAQEGEDRLLARLLGNQARGFYVDVGAHHPQRFSNTYAFYLKGWRGLNVDPASGAKKLFDRIRPDDMNLELAIGEPGPRPYHVFAESALNCCDTELARHWEKVGHAILATYQIDPVPLVSVLDEHLRANQAIDFLTVDVEGMELEVLQTNDWSVYRPRIILAEDRGMRRLEDVADSAVAMYLVDQGYTAVAKTYNTVFFLEAAAQGT